ncbi:unnamed protein product, partial [Cladocopium goreaui]
MVIFTCGILGAALTDDHTWLWHADHDDCSNKWPDSISAATCISGNGLVVYGDRTIVYGLQSEHTMQDQVYWRGNGGKVFFYQNELPYINPYFRRPGYNFGMDYVSYRVDSACLEHYAVGIYLAHYQQKSEPFLKLSKGHHISRILIALLSAVCPALPRNVVIFP